MRSVLLSLLVFFIVWPAAISAQPFKDEEGFALTESPARWKKYPVVLLCAQHEYDLRSIGKCKETLRLRYLIQDEVEAGRYSELFFSVEDAPEIQVIKASGKSEAFSSRDASRVKESEVNPSLLFSLSRELPEEYMKIKLPKLGKGDIIDMVLEAKNDFEEVYKETKVILPEAYPVVKRRLTFQMSRIQPGIQRYVVMKFQAMNGAPELKEVEDGKYEWVDENRAPRINEPWSPTLNLLPAVKYNFFWNLVGDRYLLDASSRVTTQLNEGKLLGLINRFQLDTGSPDPVYTAYRQQAPPPAPTGFEAIKESYYFERFRLAPGKKSGLNEMARCFAPVIQAGTAKVNLVALLPPGADNLKETLFLSEVMLGLHTEEGGKDYYFFEMDKLTNPGDLAPQLEGAKGYLMPLGSTLTPGGQVVNVTGWKRSPVTLPESSAEDNQVVTSITVDLSSGTTAEVERNVIVKGQSKRKFSYLVTGDDYEWEERERFQIGGKPLAPAPAEAELELQRSQRDNIVANQLQKELGAGALRALILINSGRSLASPELIFREVFGAEELMTSEGEGYSLALGKLLGEQEHFEGQDRNRLSDIYLGYARSLIYQIEVILPDGYVAEGLEKLNQEVENETGSFTSFATQSGSTLTFVATKTYPRRSLLREEWNDMLAWLDVAYRVSQERVKLRRE